MESDPEINKEVPAALSQSFLKKLKKLVIGLAKNLKDPSVSHNLSLIAFLAWVGLGADGLSSSAYGPEEAYRTLGEHTYLAVFLVRRTSHGHSPRPRSLVKNTHHIHGLALSTLIAYPGLLS